MTMMMKFVILTTLYTAVNAALPAIEEAITSAEEATIDTAMPTCEDNNKYMDEFGKVGAWRDFSSYTCKDYVDLRWCSCADGVCAVQDERYAGYGAEENCCACGRKLESEEPRTIDEEKRNLTQTEQNAPEEGHISEAPEEGSIDGTTRECGLKNTYGTECLDEWKTQRWEDETLNKHCASTEPAYHINCQSCVWCADFEPVDTKPEEKSPCQGRCSEDCNKANMECHTRLDCNSKPEGEKHACWTAEEKCMLDFTGCYDCWRCKEEEHSPDPCRLYANGTKKCGEHWDFKSCAATSQACRAEDCDSKPTDREKHACWLAEEKCKFASPDCYDCWRCNEEEHSPDPCRLNADKTEERCGERWNFESCAAKSQACRAEDCDSKSDEGDQEQCYMEARACMMQWFDSCGGKDGCFQCQDDEHGDDECKDECGGRFTEGSCSLLCAKDCMTGSEELCKACAIRHGCEKCMQCHMPPTLDAGEVTIHDHTIDTSILHELMKCPRHETCIEWSCRTWCHCFDDDFTDIYKQYCPGDDTCNCP